MDGRDKPGHDGDIHHLSPKDTANLPNKTPLPQLSLAKDKIRVLLLEGVNDSAAQLIETPAIPA